MSDTKPTPRTDSKLTGDGHTVLAEFARELERELADAELSRQLTQKDLLYWQAKYNEAVRDQ